MSNINSPCGLKPMQSLVSLSFNSKVKKYYIPASDPVPLYLYDGIKIVQNLTIDGYPYCAKADEDDFFRGIVVGFDADPNDTSLKYRKANTARYILVLEDPFVEVMVQVNGVLSSLDVGKYANIITNGGESVNGISKTELNINSVSSKTRQLLIIGLYNVENNAVGQYSKVRCLLYKHELNERLLANNPVLKPIISQLNFIVSEPAAPLFEDRYINTVTGVSSVTNQNVVKDYIYEWDHAVWQQSIPEEGDLVYDKSIQAYLLFDGAGWVLKETYLWELVGDDIRPVGNNDLDLAIKGGDLSAIGGCFYDNVTITGGSLSITSGDINLAVNRSVTIGGNNLSCDAAATHKIVGYSQYVDYQTISVAMSNISDSAENKRYLLTIAPVDLGTYTYQSENPNLVGHPYVNVSMPSGRLDGYVRLGDHNAIDMDEIYSAGNGDSGLIKESGSGHAYAFVNKIKAGNVNSRSCVYSKAGTLDLYTNYLEVGYGTAIGGDPVSGEPSSGDVTAFVNYIKLTSIGDVVNNAVVAKDGSLITGFLNRIDCIGNLKRIYTVRDANSGLYSTFNFSQTATYILDQSDGYACIRGGYTDGAIRVTDNMGTWVRLNRQGSGTNYISTISAPVYLDILECQPIIDAQAGATVYLNTQKLSGNIDCNGGAGKLICNIADWTGSFVAGKANVNGWIGVYDDSKMYLYGHNLHCNPTEIYNAHYRAGTRFTIEDMECHAQFIADDDGGAWGSYLLLSLAPSAGDNKHWLIHHSGSSQNNQLKFEYGNSTNSSSFSISQKFMFGVNGQFYCPGLSSSTGGQDVRYNTSTGELFYVS